MILSPRAARDSSSMSEDTGVAWREALFLKHFSSFNTTPLYRTNPRTLERGSRHLEPR